MATTEAFQHAALRILGWFHHAEDTLIGVYAETFKGETGIVRALELDETHGLCFTFDDFFEDRPRRFHPVSTIKEIE